MNYLFLYGTCDCGVCVNVVKSAGWLFDAWLDILEKESLNLTPVY